MCVTLFDTATDSSLICAGQGMSCAFMLDTHHVRVGVAIFKLAVFD